MTKKIEVPRWGEKGWPEYVMTLFTEDELNNGLPNANGLRRVFHQLFDVLSSRSNQIIVSPGEILVNWEVEFLAEIPVVYDVNDPYLPKRKFSACSSASQDNTSFPFSKHLASMADTRSEAKCYRKSLLLNCISADELDSIDAPETGEKVTKLQLTCITQLAQRNNININKFLAMYKEELGTDQLDKLDKASAAKASNLLNRFQSAQGKSSIPAEILEKV